jgi:hypothetical protein
MYKTQQAAARALARQCSALLAQLNGGVVTSPETIYQQACLAASREDHAIDT